MIEYRHNPEFFLKKNDKDLFFINGKGAKIRTDELTARIWDQADGRDRDGVYEGVSKVSPVSSDHLDLTLNLLTRSGVIVTEAGKNGREHAYPLVREDALVSVIIVNRNGRHHLEELLPSIESQSYSRLEVIVVDNGSSDDSVGWISKNWPGVIIKDNKKNYGFARGNNIGIEAAGGDFLFLINNDTALDKNCVGRLVKEATDYQSGAVIIPKIRFYDLPAFINAIGNSIGPRGWGSDNFIGHVDLGQFDSLEEVFSACFGAVLIPRRIMDKVGSLDPKYRFYYEDGDWSYRARLQGYKIRLAPQAIVYHKFNATMNTLSYDFKLRLLVGNRIRFALKNLNVRTALSFTRNYLKEDVRNMLGSMRRLEFKRVFTYFKAWLRLALMLPDILIKRSAVQKSRITGIKDVDLFKSPENGFNIALIDEDAWPILNSRTVRKVYLHCLADDLIRSDNDKLVSS